MSEITIMHSESAIIKGNVDREVKQVVEAYILNGWEIDFEWTESGGCKVFYMIK